MKRKRFGSKGGRNEWSMDCGNGVEEKSGTCKKKEEIIDCSKISDILV